VRSASLCYDFLRRATLCSASFSITKSLLDSPALPRCLSCQQACSLSITPHHGMLSTLRASWHAKCALAPSAQAWPSQPAPNPHALRTFKNKAGVLIKRATIAGSNALVATKKQISRMSSMHLQMQQTCNYHSLTMRSRQGHQYVSFVVLLAVVCALLPGAYSEGTMRLGVVGVKWFERIAIRHGASSQ
jgi:hypothetical protein